jgi:DNA-binding LacI/PurR family transcriptional regulator
MSTAIGKPIVLVAMKLPGYSSVNPDNLSGDYRATEHLLGLGSADRHDFRVARPARHPRTQPGLLPGIV